MMNLNYAPQKFILIMMAMLLISVNDTVVRLNHAAENPNTTSSAATTRIWTCSMHPQVRLPQPGACPICSMPLVPISASNTTSDSAESAIPMLELSDYSRSMASVETVVVQRRKLSREIRVVGKVQYNETTLALITSRVEGYVERLFVDYTGIEVNSGDHLVEIYSPDLLVAQQELLIALEGQRNPSLIESAKHKLLLWGLTQAQVDDLVRDQKISDRITLFSPIQGTVMEKMIVEKAMVKPGDMLYRLANLESIWVYLDIYESELAWVQYGQIVEVKSESIPGRIFTGRVWFISPMLDEGSRTVKVLLNILNTKRQLKPGMYVSAIIRAELLADGQPAPTGIEGQWSCPMHPLILLPHSGECPTCNMTLIQIPAPPRELKSANKQLPLAVPVSAVLDSGVRKLVYVEKSKGKFIPVEIETGPRADNSYPVLSGLNEGDLVAVRGNFLLDSQFQIRGLPSLLYREGQTAVTGHHHGNHETNRDDHPLNTDHPLNGLPPHDKHRQ